MKTLDVKQIETKPCICILLCLCFMMTALTSLFPQDNQWNLKTLPFHTGYLNGVYFINESTGWIVGRDEGAGQPIILHTTDAGDQWTSQLTGFTGELNKIAFTDQNIGYAVGESGPNLVVMKTTDGGAQWTRQTVPNMVGTLNDLFFLDGQTGWAVGKEITGQDNPLILYTPDGTTWNKATYPQQFGHLNSVHFADTNNGWAVGKNLDTNAPYILFSNDGGLNWIEQSNPIAAGELFDVFFINNQTGWATGGTGLSDADTQILLKTEDGGLTWTDISPAWGTRGMNVYFTSETEGFLAVNTRNGTWSTTVYQSNDGGTTWQQAVGPIYNGFTSDTHILPATTTSHSLQKPQSWYYPVYLAGSINEQPSLHTSRIPREGQAELSSIVIAPQNQTIQVGQSIEFTAEGRDQNNAPIDITDPHWVGDGQHGDITVNPTDPTKCTYRATIVGEGYIMCYEGPPSGGGIHGDTDIIVEEGPQLTSIVITPSNPTIQVGQHVEFTAEGRDQKFDPIEITDPHWEGDGQHGDITINPTDPTKCTYAATNAGQGYIQCYEGPPSGGGIHGDTDITVEESPHLTSIVITPSNPTVQVGQSVEFTAEGRDQNNAPIDITDPHWEGDGQYGDITINPTDPTKCTYTATSAGQGYILCYEGSPSGGGIHGDTGITVEEGPQLTSIVITPSNPTIQVGQSVEFTVEGRDQNDQPININDPHWVGDGQHGDITINPTDPTKCTYTATSPGYGFIECWNGEPGGGGIHARNNFIVTAENAMLTMLRLRPEDFEMGLGQSQDIIAHAKDQDGNPFPLYNPGWYCTGAGTMWKSALTKMNTVSDSSIFVYTPIETGDHIIVCTDSATGIADTAYAHVTETSIKSNHISPKDFILYQNHPNPFNPETTIRFSLTETNHVILNVYDLQGRTIAELVNSQYQPGNHSVLFNAQSLPSGIYIYTIQTGNNRAVRKMVLLE